MNQINIQHKIIHVDHKTKQNWCDPLGYMNGYRSVYCQFDNGLTGLITQCMSLEPEDYFVFQLYKDEKIVAKSFYDDVNNPMTIKYDGTEYSIKLEF